MYTVLARGTKTRAHGGVMVARMIDVERLRRKTLFEGLKDEQLAGVAAQARERHVAAGEVVIGEGEVGDRVYVLERGRVAITLSSADGGQAQVAVLARGARSEGIGDFFGEFCLFDLEPRSATVVAREASVILELEREGLYDLFERDVDLRINVALNIARVLAQRLRELNLGGGY